MNLLIEVVEPAVKFKFAVDDIQDQFDALDGMINRASLCPLLFMSCLAISPMATVG